MKRLKTYLLITQIIDEEMIAQNKKHPSYNTKVCDRASKRIVKLIQNNYRRRKP